MSLHPLDTLPQSTSYGPPDVACTLSCAYHLTFRPQLEERTLTMFPTLDRVFVHALNTVKKIPRTGSARPPPADRLRLYGLYKQAMEGDVDGVMDRPGGGGYTKDEDTIREQEKWDAWDAQKGVSRTEAKRRYIEALIETMHRYASTTS